jgi:quinol monooxygenase YgiN
MTGMRFDAERGRSASRARSAAPPIPEGDTLMPITVIAKIKAKAGSEGEVESAFREMIGKVRANEPATLIYALHKSVQDPTTFVFYEVYQDQAAFDAHGKTEHMKELGGKLGGKLEGRPAVDILNEVARK